MGLADTIGTAVTSFTHYAPGTSALQQIVGDLEVPCEFYEDGRVLCQNDPAQWVMHRNPCCPATMYPVLACDTCKDARVMDMIALECRHCGHIWENAPDAYSMIEKLDKKPGRNE
jgi:hypothetical protein